MSIKQVKAAAWYRVSTGHQDSDNQVPDVQTFTAHHGYELARTYTISDTAWKNGGGPEYRKTLQQALDDAHAGRFSVLVVWRLDRICRSGAEEALRLIRLFRERGCILVSVHESWLNGSPEVQDVLVAFAGWMAAEESRKRNERIRAGLERRRAEGKPVGRQRGSADKGTRKKSGYYQAWEPDGARRQAARQRAGQGQQEQEAQS